MIKLVAGFALGIMLGSHIPPNFTDDQGNTFVLKAPWMCVIIAAIGVVAALILRVQ